MSTEIVKAEGQQDQFLAVIERIAANPDADVNKLEKMLDMQERVMAKNAEIAFNDAMARLQTQIPVIKKTAKGHNNKYAKYEHIEAVVRPLYTAEGFSISYDSKRNGEQVEYYGTICHKEGHSKTASMILPADTGGSKNAIQAIGSTVSYAKRYLLTMLLNIVTEEEDDDGASGGSKMVSEEQLAYLEKLMEQAGVDAKTVCENAKVPSLAEMNQQTYKRTVNGLKTKISKAGQ